MREIVNYVTDSEGDCWLLQMMREIADYVTDSEGDWWPLQTMRDCWLWYRTWGTMLTMSEWQWLMTVAQTMREIVDCSTDPEEDCWLWHRPWGWFTVLLIMRVADWVTENVGDSWICYGPWGRLLTVHRPWGRLTVLLIMRVADCVTENVGDCWLCHSWPWIEHITCALWFWHCIMSILYSLSLPWITDGFEPSSIQNLIKQFCPTFLLTSVNTILQYDETVKCILEKWHVKWLYRNDTDPCHCLWVTVKIPGQIWATSRN